VFVQPVVQQDATPPSLEVREEKYKRCRSHRKSL